VVSAASRSIRMIGNKAPADEATPKRQTRVWQGEPTIIPFGRGNSRSGEGGVDWPVEADANASSAMAADSTAVCEILGEYSARNPLEAA
jgi:hypothetical protein